VTEEPLGGWGAVGDRGADEGEIYPSRF